MIAGFWRRLFAFLADSLLLGLAGQAIGWLAFSRLSDMGAWGRVVGFLIALIYFGVMDSGLFKGQTLGARLARIKVVTVLGLPLKLGSSFVRTIIFALPFFLNGAPITPDLSTVWPTLLIAVVVFGLGLSIVYLYLFNRATRQCPHDLAVRAYVVRAGSEAAPGDRRIWRGHYVAIAVIVVTAALVSLYVPVLSKKEPFAALISVQHALQQVPGVRFATVNNGAVTSNILGKGSTTTYTLSARILLSQKLADTPADRDALANALAKTILDTDPTSEREGRIILQLSYGYDIGIASSWRTETFAHSPGEWRQRFAASANGGDQLLPSIAE